MYNYFKISKDSDLGKSFTDLLEKCNKAREATNALIKEITQLDDVEYFKPLDSIAGGIHSIPMATAPDMTVWKIHPQTKAYLPRATKKGNLIREKFDALPYVSQNDLNAIIGFKSHLTISEERLKNYKNYGLLPVENWYLIMIFPQSSWEQPVDMIEITKGEYDKLAKKGETEP